MDRTGQEGDAQTLNDIKPIGMDAAGYQVMQNAVLDLLNRFPGLTGETVVFQGLTENYGMSVEPSSGALVYTESTDIVGGVHQTCQFPFFLVYRSDTSDEYQKLWIANLLDSIGAWICREPVVVDGEDVRLTEYPELSGGRKITRVTRENSYTLTPNENKTQDWVIPITVFYNHDFYS